MVYKRRYGIHLQNAVKMFYMLLMYVVLITVCNAEIVVVPSIRRQYDLYAPNHIIKSIHPTSLFTCAELCLTIKLCVSFNFLKNKSKCELNSGGIAVTGLRESSIFVKKEDIPKEYGNECADHSCSIYEMCSIGRNKSITCLPLDLECGDPKVFPRTVSLTTGTKMRDITQYRCENGTIPVGEFSWKEADNFKFVCEPNRWWNGPTFSCADCYHNPHNTNVKITETLTKRKCQHWKDVLYPELQNATFGSGNNTETENFCSSPLTGNHYERPYLWCITDDPDMVFDICPIPRCYDKGPPASKEGLPSVNYSVSYQFSDVSTAHFQCNYITNVTRPYCPVSRYENDTWSPVELSCSDVDCYDNSTQYRGQMTCTVTGRTCQNWNSQYPHAHNYTLDAVDQGSNYCRNPDGYSGVPWCLTTDPLVRYEYCWIPNCT